MNWSKFEDKFHPSWHGHMRKFIESEECDKIYEFLKHESKRGKQIAPLSGDLWRCFKETSYDDLKVVFIGMCPYHTFYKGFPVADGLMMGCSVTGQLQPSLEQFYGGIERELYGGLALGMKKPADVSYLAHQGVLMCNAALTTEMNKAGSHIDLWEPFMKFLLTEVLDYTGRPIVFFGKEASKYAKHVLPFTFKYTVSHPASAAYKHSEWDTEGIFTIINNHLQLSNNESIEWLQFEQL